MYLAPLCALAQLLADLQNQGKGFVRFCLSLSCSLPFYHHTASAFRLCF